MENTLEYKAKFFALYWGQKVIEDNFWFPNQLSTIGKCAYKLTAHADSKIGGLKEEHLVLYDLLSITDEDAIELTKILKYKDDEYFLRNFGRKAFEQLKNEIQETKNGFLGHIVNETSRVLKSVDYLRSKGYYIGDGEEIKYGWVRLIKHIKN